jgi:hypothetical protein
MRGKNFLCRTRHKHHNDARPKQAKPDHHMSRQTPKCAICLGALVSPEVLPTCGHSFCAACIEGLPVTLTSERIEAQCPLCRMPFAVGSSVPNWSLREATQPDELDLFMPEPMQTPASDLSEHGAASCDDLPVVVTAVEVADKDTDNGLEMPGDEQVMLACRKQVGQAGFRALVDGFVKRNCEAFDISSDGAQTVHRQQMHAEYAELIEGELTAGTKEAFGVDVDVKGFVARLFVRKAADASYLDATEDATDECADEYERPAALKDTLPLLERFSSLAAFEAHMVEMNGKRLDQVERQAMNLSRYYSVAQPRAVASVPQEDEAPGEDATEGRRRRLKVDHLVYGVADLKVACERFEEQTGVRPIMGGQHLGLGTHNALVALGEGAYFELIARDPAQPSPPRTWMGIERVGKEPVMLTWATDRAGGLAETVETARRRGYDPGDAKGFSRVMADGRGELHWTLAYNHYTAPLPGNGVVPFLIEWQTYPSAPSVTAPTGCTLLSLRAEAPNASALREVSSMLRAIGIAPEDMDLKITAGDGGGMGGASNGGRRGMGEPPPQIQGAGHGCRLIAKLSTPKGVVELS